MTKPEITISIDEITECIIHRESNKVYQTGYELIKRKITKAEAKNDISHGWNFDWSQIQENEYLVYELFTVHDNKLQGRISIKEDSGFLFVGHAENRPENIGELGIYKGVGANLFAIACKISYDFGNEGFVAFVTKYDDKLINHYKDTLHAKQVGISQRMVIDSEAAKYLIEKYKL